MTRSRIVLCLMLGQAVLLSAMIFPSPELAAPQPRDPATDPGTEIFQQKCSSCHGESMQGGDHGPSLRDDRFWEEWEGQPARSLYSRIISTMPLDDPGGLAEQDVIKLVDHIVMTGGGDLGDKLPEKPNDLNNIKLHRHAH
jgi:mono/diheme cytochrome c family protein